MRLVRTLLLAALITTTSSTTAQATRWVTYTEADGLPSHVVVDLVQVPDGSVWAATWNGIARLDRRQPAGHWEVVTDEVFDALAVDSNGIIWAGGKNGRLQWFDVHGDSLPTPVQLPQDASGDVTALEPGPGGEMWIGQGSRLAGSRLRRWLPNPPTLDGWAVTGTIRDLDITVMGHVWVGTDAGLGFFDGTSLELYLIGDKPADKDTHAVLALDNDNEVLAGSNSGKAYFFSRKTYISVDIPIGDTGTGQAQPVEDITRDALGRIWFARKEAYRFDTHGSPTDPRQWTRTVFSAEDGLNGDVLNVIIETSPFLGTTSVPVASREMWFGNDLGVVVQTGLPWTNFRSDNGDLTGNCPTDGCDIINAIALDPRRDALWFGADWGLSRLRNGSEWEYWTNGIFPGDPAGLVGSTIYALHLDDDGKLWVACGHTSEPTGVQVYDWSSDAWDTLGVGEDRWRVWDITRDQSGFLWLAAKDGAWRLDTSTQPFVATHFDAQAGLPLAPLRAVAAGSGYVFVASPQGIARYDPATGQWSTWPFYELPAQPSDVRDLLVLNDKLFAATNAGLIGVPVRATSLAEATVLSSASTVPGGFTNQVWELADGGNGTVLAATLSGLYRVSAALDKTGRMGVLDGLPEEEVLSVATDGDEVWIGTLGDGAAGHRFEPPETAIVAPPPQVVVSNANPILVGVAGADGDSPEELLRFELRVDDGAWQQPQPGPTLSFVPTVGDGPHVLQVRAVDNGLLFDGTPAAAAFEVDTSPPVARVSSPSQGDAVRGVVTILGTTDDTEDHRFQSYSVNARRHGSSDPPITLQDSTDRAVVDSVIATWDTRALEDDWYTLKVVVKDVLGVQGVLQFEVLVDNHPPFAEVTSPVRVRGSDGGTVYSVAGDAVLVIPPFAFDGERSVVVRRESADAPGGFGFRLEPTDLRFQKSATLQLALPPGVEEDDMVAIHRQVEGGWTPLGGTREVRNDGVFYSVAIDRTGLYALRSGSAVPSNPAVISSLNAEPRHFRPRTGGVDRVSVSFVLGRPASVSAMVYSRAGRPRRVITEGLQLGAGEQVLYWDGRDHDGSLVASGLYIISVDADGERVTKVVTVGPD